jgi:hypothetical protein
MGCATRPPESAVSALTAGASTRPGREIEHADVAVVARTWSADGTRIAFVWGHDEVNVARPTGVGRASAHRSAGTRTIHIEVEGRSAWRSALRAAG